MPPRTIVLLPHQLAQVAETIGWHKACCDRCRGGLHTELLFLSGVADAAALAETPHEQTTDHIAAYLHQNFGASLLRWAEAPEEAYRLHQPGPNMVMEGRMVREDLSLGDERPLEGAPVTDETRYVRVTFTVPWPLVALREALRDGR